MYHQRLKIFVLLCIGGLVVAVGRLLYLQSFEVNHARQTLVDIRIRRPKQLPTIRGKILDRNGKSLALDRPVFSLYINYSLTRYVDPRWQEGTIQRSIGPEETYEEVRDKLVDEWAEPVAQLYEAIELANTLANVSRESLIDEIDRINNRIWELTRYLYWRNKNPNRSYSEYKAERNDIPPEKILGEPIREMTQSHWLVDLDTQQDRLRAERAIVEIEELDIRSQARRSYPYKTSACQLLGWVAPGNAREIELFDEDEYMRYLNNEVLGKSGIERVYEPVLRGRRGEIIKDVEGNVLLRKDPVEGGNVQLTLDIDLQQKIEKLVKDPTENEYHYREFAVVVLETGSNDILSLVSTPMFDLNTIRESENYRRVFGPSDPNKIWMHKALEKNYPPGSTAKPIIMVAGLEEGKITPAETISCSCYKLPGKGWPKCILQWKYHTCHDSKFDGNNNGRNAIRGSCNVYFSVLAARMTDRVLQEWFLRFGYGQAILHTPMPEDVSVSENYRRTLRQAYGSLIIDIQKKPAQTLEDLEPISSRYPTEKRMWGIGQGNIRVTALQVANALSTIVRDGVAKSPRLIYNDDDPFNEANRKWIGISPRSISVVRSGMKAVINERNGTAYDKFKTHLNDFKKRDMTLYGKTGSTQDPEHAWFESFAEDSTGRGIIVVILVEKGESGGGEAAPIGVKILQLCNEMGYVGRIVKSDPDPESDLPQD